MPITAGHLKVIVRGLILGQEWENIQWYAPGGAAFVTATAAGVAEAYWNDVKSAWRAIVGDDGNMEFDSVYVAEPGSGGAYGEYAVPAGERLGTRVTTSLGDMLPPFTAAAVRLTVATRDTRPGQKRVCGLYEADNFSGVLQSAYHALLETLAAKWDSPITLGAPVATGLLTPEIVHLDPTTHEPTVGQAVIGHLANYYISSQNSRKVGRGA